MLYWPNPKHAKSCFTHIEGLQNLTKIIDLFHKFVIYSCVISCRYFFIERFLQALCIKLFRQLLRASATFFIFVISDLGTGGKETEENSCICNALSLLIICLWKYSEKNNFLKYFNEMFESMLRENLQPLLSSKVSIFFFIANAWKQTFSQNLCRVSLKLYKKLLNISFSTLKLTPNQLHCWHLTPSTSHIRKLYTASVHPTFPGKY